MSASFFLPLMEKTEDGLGLSVVLGSNDAIENGEMRDYKIRREQELYVDERKWTKMCMHA